MPKEIKLAKFAGFCYGVKRAVETVKKLKAENPDKKVSVLGELIHNTDVINELESLGINTITEIPEHGEGICVVRSHGESPEVIEKIKNAGFTTVDLTCPDVKKVQHTAIELAKKEWGENDSNVTYNVEQKEGNVYYIAVRLNDQVQKWYEVNTEKWTIQEY